jgi:predicted  nucleic acid-binding Zn-ribbon protein
MNKRIRAKVAKRENGGVLPAEFKAKAKKPSAPNNKPGAKGKSKPKARTAKASPVGAVEKARAAVESAVSDVQHRVESAVSDVQNKVASKVADLKDKLHSTEQQAEEALSKIPLVGKAAAKKLHDLTK